MFKYASVFVASLTLSAAAQAVTVLTANLTNSQENPPTTPTLSTGGARPASFGTATFVLNDLQTAMTFSATIFNIDFTGTQTADVNDNNPNDVVVTPFATGVGGTISGKWDALEGNNTTLAAQLPNILAGNAYINFHTTQFAGGEIRGAIQAIPEPETYALMLGGLGLMAAAARRRKA
jgi:hypothetical protein